jgi:hypothetical protein
MNNIPHNLHYEWKVIHDGIGRTPNIRASSSSWIYNNYLWLLCGSSAGVGKTSEIWRFDLKSKVWSKVETSTTDQSPPGRDGQSGSYIGNGKYCIFGGQGFPEPNQKLGKESDLLKTQTYWKREVYNDLWIFDCNSLTWLPIYPDGLSFPMGRRGHSCIYVKKLTNHVSASTTVAAGGKKPPLGDDQTHAGSDSIFSQSNTSYRSSNGGDSHHPDGGTGGHSHDHQHHHVPPPVSRSGASSSRSGAGAPKENVTTLTELPVLENCLVVYGGAGIELSKYTEQLYNDVWIFSFDYNMWIKQETKGIDPIPTVDHRVYKLNELMIILGGIIDTSPNSVAATKFSSTNTDSSSANSVSDIQILNLMTMTWSFLPLTTISSTASTSLPFAFSSQNDNGNGNNKGNRLNLHDFIVFPDRGYPSLPSDGKSNSRIRGAGGREDPSSTSSAISSLILFGGNQVLDTKTAISSKSQRLRERSSSEATFLLNIDDCTLSQLSLKGGLYPENRYLHIGVSSTPVIYDFEMVEGEEGGTEEGGKGGGVKRRQKGESSRKSFLPGSVDLRTEETIGYVYGGSNIDNGGYCDPVLYSLIRVKTIDPNSLRMSSAPVAAGSSSSINSSLKGNLTSRSNKEKEGKNSNQTNSFAQNTGRNVLSSFNNQNSSIMTSGVSGGDDFLMMMGPGGNSTFFESTTFDQGGGITSPSSSSPLKNNNDSIWISIQNKNSDASSSSASSYKNKTYKEPNNWEEFKLSLTASRSMKSFDVSSSLRSSLLSSDNNGGANGKEGFAKDNHRPLSSSMPSRPSSHRSINNGGKKGTLSKSTKIAQQAASLSVLSSSKAVPFLKNYNTKSHEDLENRMSQSQLLLEYRKKVLK